jgi:hypothetical protein
MTMSANHRHNEDQHQHQYQQYLCSLTWMTSPTAMCVTNIEGASALPRCGMMVLLRNINTIHGVMMLQSDSYMVDDCWLSIDSKMTPKSNKLDIRAETNTTAKRQKRQWVKKSPNKTNKIIPYAPNVEAVISVSQHQKIIANKTNKTKPMNRQDEAKRSQTRHQNET